MLFATMRASDTKVMVNVRDMALELGRPLTS
jgi:hypothetical protein